MGKWRFWAVGVLTALLWVVIASAHQSAAVPLVPPIDPNSLYEAIKLHQWILVGALGIYGLATLAKQGWLSTWLQQHLPKRALPFVAPLLGELLLSSSELIAHIPWPRAIFDGAFAGVLAVWGHQAVIESLLAGKEVLPAKGTNTGNGGGPQLSKVTEFAKVASTPPPKTERRAFAWLAAAVVLVISCTPQERADVKNAADFILQGTQLACVEVSALATSAEVAKACKIDLQAAPGLETFLDQLLSQKAAAQKAGFEWHPPPRPIDAGSSLNVTLALCRRT